MPAALPVEIELSRNEDLRLAFELIDETGEPLEIPTGVWSFILRQKQLEIVSTLTQRAGVNNIFDAVILQAILAEEMPTGRKFLGDLVRVNEGIQSVYASVQVKRTDVVQDTEDLGLRVVKVTRNETYTIAIALFSAAEAAAAASVIASAQAVENVANIISDSAQSVSDAAEAAASAAAILDTIEESLITTGQVPGHSLIYKGRQTTIDETGREGQPLQRLPRFSIGTSYRDPALMSLRQDRFMRRLILARGQSYTFDNSGTGSPYNTAALYPGLAQMFNTGTWPGALPISNFVDLTGGVSLGAVRDPPIVEAVNHIVGALVARFGTCDPITACIVAEGGKAYLDQMEGSPRFLDGVRYFREFARLCRTEGSYPEVEGILYHWGEGDAAISDEFFAYMHILADRQALQDAAEYVLGQTRTIKAVLYSTNRAPFSGGLRESAWQAGARMAAEIHPHLFCLAGPAYAVEIDATEHPTLTGSRRLGLMLGKAALAHFFGTGFIPTRAVKWYFASSTQVVIECHVPYSGTLVRDESGLIVGYPTDNTLSNYIGPTPSTGMARDAGIYASDKDGFIGTAVSVSGTTMTINLSRAAHAGSTKIGIGVRGQSGSLAGTGLTTARTIIRGSVATALPGGAVPLHDFIIPQILEM